MSKQKTPDTATLNFWIAQIEHRTVPIERCVPHPRNPRVHPPGQISDLRASYRRFGQYRSLVGIENARTEGNVWIAAGCGTLEAMNEEKAKTVDIGFLPPDTPEEVVEGIMIADNNLSAKAVDNEELLAMLLQEQQDAGYDLASLGSDDEALRQMLASLGDSYLGSDSREDGAGGDEFDTTPDEEQTRVRLGDIWSLGRHRIGCIDSLDAEQVKRLLDGKTAQFVFSDPPYGIEIVATNGYVGGGEAYDIPFGGVKKARGDVGGTAAHMRKTGKPYIAEKGTVGRISYGMKSIPIQEQGKYAPVIGDNSTVTAITSHRLYTEFFPKAVQVWWGANHYAHALPPSSCWIVWDKENNESFFADCELAWTNQKTAVRMFRHMWNGLMKDSERGERRVHPTQKPIALAYWCFEKYGKDNDVIYDPFLGSGISVIAAERLGRTVIGCELSPAYINVVIQRWERETGQTAQLLERIEVPAHA